MSEPIGERFIEGRIVNLDKESVENLERILNQHVVIVKNLEMKLE